MQANGLILIVDDDLANRTVASRVLAKKYRILLAESGEQCLDAMDQHRDIDLVLLDLMMPRISGFDILERMGADKTRKWPRVIVLSALMDSDTISRTLRLGAVDYLSKPFNRDELIARVDSQVMLANRELQLENLVQERTAELEKAHAELKSRFQQLVHSEKMASIGQITAGIAHEINNPMSYVSSNVALLSEYFDSFSRMINLCQTLRQSASLQDAPEIAPVLQEMATIDEKENLEFVLEDLPALLHDTNEGIKRIKDIADSMRRFSHSDDGSMSQADINEGIETSIKVAWNQLKGKCTLDKELGSIPTILCNINQLNQVFTNILINASHVMPERDGRLKVSSGLAGEEIWVRIADNGSGMSPEVQAHIFQPFYTTKPQGEGTGLGLYLSREIIHGHGGRIEVQSDPGMGTEFSIYLPCNN